MMTLARHPQYLPRVTEKNYLSKMLQNPPSEVLFAWHWILYDGAVEADPKKRSIHYM